MNVVLKILCVHLRLHLYLHLNTDKELVTASNRFHEALATGDYKGFCAMKAATAETVSDQQVRTARTPVDALVLTSSHLVTFLIM